MISFVGAQAGQAQFLGMKPESTEYRQWLKDSLLALFLPLLEELIFAEKNRRKSGEKKPKSKKSKNKDNAAKRGRTE